jgi:CoA:oxalate CoA-transferase
MPSTPLQNLRLNVVELAEGVAGPYCGRVLAGYGARVIKVEHPRGGDWARRLRPFKDDIADDERSGFFAYLNANKLGVTLDWSNPSGRELLGRLVADADLVLTSGTVRGNEALALSHEDFVGWNPRVVSVSITPFGETGPYRNYRGVELTLEAMGGLMARTGLRSREPLKEWGYQVQFIAGADAIPAALSAVIRARRTGRGGHVDLSIMEAGIQFLQSTLMKWSFEGIVVGREAQSTAANKIFPCKDGYVGIFAPGSGTGWRNAAAVMGDPRLADPRFRTQTGREQHEDELDAIILPWTLEHTKEEIYHKGQAAGLPFAPVRTTAEFLASEHHRVRGFIRRTTHPVLGTYEAPGMPFRLDSPQWRDEPAPTLGQHNQTVYGDLLGIPTGDLIALRERGVI